MSSIFMLRAGVGSDVTRAVMTMRVAEAAKE
jgi:hypothetical protein